MNADPLRHDPAFAAMTLDILHKLLSRADNPGQLVAYLSEEIRELTGARCVLFLQCLGEDHRVLGVNPARQQAWAEAAERVKLFESIHTLTATEVWDPATTSDPIRLRETGHFGLSMAVPLHVGAVKVGAMLVLGLPDQRHLASEIRLLNTLAAIVALVLRNSFLFENQEIIIARRTRDLTLSAFSLDNLDDAVFWINRAGRFWKVNASACTRLGYSEQELLTLGIRDIDPQFPEEGWPGRWQLLKKAGSLHFDTVHRTRDGRLIPVDITTNFIELEGEEYNCAIVRDISAYKQAEAALKRSEERFELAMRASSDGVFDWNLTTQEIYFSPGWKKMLGYEDHELANDFAVWQQLTDPADQPRSWEILQEHLQGKRDRYEMEFRMRHKSGSWVDILSRAGAIFAADGTPVRVVGTHVDITARNQAAAEKEKLQLQLTQAQKMESVGRLAGGVAHDFNNMLGVILGYTEMLLEQGEEDKGRRLALEGIHQAAQRSAKLTGQLLAFARKQTVAPKILDLNQTVAGMLTMLGRLLGEGIKLVWRPEGQLATVKIDPSQIDQILVNLCVNARDATDGAGTITIETGNVAVDAGYHRSHPEAIAGDYVLLAVSDSGCGMDKETQAHLFEPFFTTKEPGKGTGLGLATVYGIVRQNNGFVNVYSEPGRGTAFRIYLPRHGDGVAAAPDTVEGPSLTGSGTILLVEDEPMILEMTTLVLRKQGYQVLATLSPGEAVRIAETHPCRIDLLLTDVVMPEMNGRDLANTLLARTPDLKCLFMSGYNADLIAHHGVLDQGVHFIQKPFSMKELVTRIKAALTPSSPRD
jgi:two-component system, cell cycle sensor histidine kinase and response regulator CckA